jgi:hypothetical protein
MITDREGPRLATGDPAPVLYAAHSRGVALIFSVQSAAWTWRGSGQAEERATSEGLLGKRRTSISASGVPRGNPCRPNLC